MSDDRDEFYNLAERIEDAFSEIDSDVVVELFANDGEYAAMKKDTEKIKLDYPLIENVLNGSREISLTANEHEALARYVNLIRQMEDMERQRIYFRGHTDCFSYLKKIGAI